MTPSANHHAPTLVRLALAVALAAPALAQGADGLFSDHLLTEDRSTRFEALLDLDGDGSRYVVGWWWRSGSRIDAHWRGFNEHGALIEDGSSTFTPSLGQWVHHEENASSGGDLGGDGRDDLVVAIGDQLLVLSYDAAMGWRPLSLVQELLLPSHLEDVPRTALVSDFDLDGRAELVLAFPHEVRLYVSDSTGVISLREAVPVPAGLAAHRKPSVEAVDVDGDGTFELALFSPDLDRVSIFPLDTGVLGSPEIYRTEVGGEKSQSAAGDVDGDGHADVVIFQEEIAGSAPHFQVLRGDGAGGLIPGSVRVGGPAASFVDVDGDGDLDGVCCGGGTGSSSTFNEEPSIFRVCLNDGTGQFDIAASFDGLGAHHLAGAMDLDGDGDLDLLAGRGMIFNNTGFSRAYCPETLNSTGGPGVLSASGSANHFAGDLRLHLDGLPAGATYLLVSGRTYVNPMIPVGGGLLCIPGAQRSHIGVADGTGTGTIDLGPHGVWGLPTGTGSGAGLNWPGSVVALQVWHRDLPSAGFSNLTNALSIFVTP